MACIRPQILAENPEIPDKTLSVRSDALSPRRPSREGEAPAKPQNLGRARLLTSRKTSGGRGSCRAARLPPAVTRALLPTGTSGRNKHNRTVRLSRRSPSRNRIVAPNLGHRGCTTKQSASCSPPPLKKKPQAFIRTPAAFQRPRRDSNLRPSV